MITAIHVELAKIICFTAIMATAVICLTAVMVANKKYK